MSQKCPHLGATLYCFKKGVMSFVTLLGARILYWKVYHRYQGCVDVRTMQKTKMREAKRLATENTLIMALKVKAMAAAPTAEKTRVK